MNYGPLNQALEKYNVYPDAAHFSSFKEQYQEKHGAKGWTAAAVKDIFGKSASDKNAFAKGSPEYKAAKTGYDNSLRQIQRWSNFGTGNGKQATNPQKASATLQDKLASIGKTLEPIKKDVPAGGITVTVTGTQGSGRHSREREFTTHMDYQTALQFVQDPTLEDLFDEIYPDWDDAVDVLFGDDSGHLDGVGVTA